MRYHDIALPVALQRYLDIPPIACRQRELTRVLALSGGSRVHVVSVDAPVQIMAGLEDTRAKLRRFVKPLKDAGIEVTSTYLTGRPGREVLGFLDKVGADLAIAGSHSKRGPLDIGLGSIASELMSKATCTVLLLRPSLQDAEHTRELMIPGYPLVFPYP